LIVRPDLLMHILSVRTCFLAQKKLPVDVGQNLAYLGTKHGPWKYKSDQINVNSCQIR